MDSHVKRRLAPISLVFVLSACGRSEPGFLPSGPSDPLPTPSQGSLDNPNVPNARVEGTYTATFTATPQCLIPEEVRSRTYVATITQRPSSPSDVLDVTLSGANFVEHSSPGPLNRFLGDVLDDQISFDLLQPGVAEEASPGMFFVISGRGRARVGESSIPLDGGLHYGADPWGDSHTSCDLDRLVLTPR